MAEEYGLIAKRTLESIGDAIREKLQTSGKVIPRDMAELIRSIVTGIKGYNVTCGSITYASSVGSGTLSTIDLCDIGMTMLPDFFVLVEDGIISGGTTNRSTIWGVVKASTSFVVYRNYGATSGNAYIYPNSYFSIKGTTIQMYTDAYLAPATYHWVAFIRTM